MTGPLFPYPLNTIEPTLLLENIPEKKTINVKVHQAY